jgi:DNA-binding transcriptional regulator PaaX
MNLQTEQTFSVAFMPDGRPAPAVMTSVEVIEFLRLDGHGERTLKFYRDEGKIVGVRIGRKVRYPLSEVMLFLAQKVANVRSNG